MTNSNSNSPFRVHKRSVIAIGAGVLIGLGLVLQWTEVLFTRFISQNAWFFATLFGGCWNIINASPAAAQWNHSLRYWPMLLVITGAAILFSRCPIRTDHPGRICGKSHSS